MTGLALALRAPDGTISAVDAAALLNVPHKQLNRWLIAWHGITGHGSRRRLDPVDLRVAQAWREISRPRGARCSTVAVGRLRCLAEQAIRAHPDRWLLVTADRASTHPTAAAAARAWDGRGAATIIDCGPA